MNTHLSRASSCSDGTATSPSETRRRPKFSPRRTFSVATRAFLTLALATCALGAAASAQTISISPPANSPNTPEGSGGGQTPFEFTVSIDQAPTQDVTVNFAINNGPVAGGATGSPDGTGADFANGVGSVIVSGNPSTNNTLTFKAGSAASQTIVVPVTADNSFETDETFSVSLDAPTGGAGIGTANATATIVNDDNQPFISIANAQAVPEGGPGATNNANFTVTLSAASGQDITFTYNTITADQRNAGDGTDLNNLGMDFVPQNNQVGRIQAGQTTTNIAVPIIGDSEDEADGMFQVEISNVNGAVISNAQAIGIILDDDGPTVSVQDATVSEGDGQIVFNISLSAPSPQPITVRYRTGSNSAIAGQDYGVQGSNAEFDQTVTFDAFTGDPSTGTAPTIPIPIPIIDDATSEPTEIFNFTIISASNNASTTGAGSRRQAIGTILDNDGSPNLTVKGPANGVIEGNGNVNTPAVFQINLSNPSSRTVTFRYMTVAGTALENQDYTGIQTSRVGTIVAGQTSATVSVNIVGDNIDEADETFGLRVFGAAPNDVTIDNSTEQTATTTIIDDDGPTASIVPTNVNVNEGNNGANTASAFTVQLNNTSPQDVTVSFTLGGGGNNANEATRGADYTSQTVSGTLTFPAGTTTQQIPVSIIGDNVKETNEIITLTLSGSNGGSLGTAKTGTITIIDDDVTPVLNIVAPVASREGNSGVTNFVFKVSLDRPTSSEVTVNYTVNDGTATSGSDFTLPGGVNGQNQLTFNPGTTGPQNITVPVIADRLNEEDENFSVSLSGVSASARIGVGSATATILNDDATPVISILDSAGLETGDPPPTGQQQGPRIIPFTVRLNTPSGKDVTFVAQTSGATTTTPTLTALSGADFVPINGQQFTIPAGQLSPTQPLAVVVVADTLDEDNERFSVTLSSVVNATISRGGAIGTITDDDAAPNIKVVAPTADNTAIEPYVADLNGTPTNGRNAIFPVTLSAASGRTITVRYSIAGTTNSPASSNDFLISPTDQTRTFQQQGTLTFTPNGNGVTPTTQNIVLFPRGDDGNEDDIESYVININATNANFAAQADAMAASTIADRDPLFNNFAPDAGNQPFGNVPGTLLTITGNQFITDRQVRVAAVRFTGPTGAVLNATNLNVTADTITARVPAGAFSSTITLVLTSGRILNTVDPGSRRLFYVQPVVTSFNPTEGVPLATQVTINGLHFKDPRNPVTEVRFGLIPSTQANADRGFTVVSDTQITAFVPRGAVSGPISIRTASGGIGPGSEQTFTVNAFAQGGVQFAAGSNTSAIFENAQATIRQDNGQILNPVKALTLQLRPATQNNGNNTPIAPRRSLRVNVSLTAAVPAGFGQTAPVIQIDPRLRVPGISLVGSGAGTITFDVAAGRDPNLDIPILVTYAGNDAAPPAAQTNLAGTTNPTTGVTIPANGSGVTMTMNATIISSNDPELYPAGAGSAAPALTFQRIDFHTFATDSGVISRTTEDQNSPSNRVSVPLNLANLDFPNPDPFTTNGRTVTELTRLNDDARPERDVLVALTSDTPTEGRLTYYVLVNGQKVYPSGDQARDTIQVIYATNPAAPEYYRNPHFIEAIGQDDNVSDPDQPYRIRATNVTSTDSEYNFQLNVPFQFVNTDNEQSPTNGNSPAYLFSKLTLNTNESGSTDTFTARLRVQPRGNVVINFQTDRPEEVLFVDPNNTRGPGLSSINVTFLATGNGNPNNFTTNWRVALPITVRGVDDNITDLNQQAAIISSVVSSGDTGYGSIDPPDLLDTNTDNETNGVIVTPTTITVAENQTGTFSVRLGAQPTSNVNITFFSSDPTITTVVSGSSLTFTPDNFSTPQIVTVRGLPSGTFTQQRTATIVSSAASSGDTNFNGLTVADVSVIVQGTNSAFVVNVASTGLVTRGAGTSDLFTVSLSQQPTSPVTLILSVSPASEARLSRTTSGGTPSLMLTFPANSNYANPQTVYVIGQNDGINTGDKQFTVTGRVVTTDPTFTNQTFPAISGVNSYGTTGGGGGGGNTGTTSFAANSTYTFSVPFATSTAATGTIPVRSLFSPSTASDFRIYRFDAANQQNSRVIGNDFQLVPNTGSLQRGVGYLLQTGNTPVTLNTSAQALTGTSFSVALTRNKNFLTQTGMPATNNGYNFIGFPFNPSQFASVSFTSAKVTYAGTTYSNVRDAAAAGVISDRLFTMDARGNLTEVSATDQVLRPYRAYFVQIYKDNVTLTFGPPSTN